MILSKGEIWWVNFDPGTGHEFQKIRPAIIIESNTMIKKTNLITIMPLTSTIDRRRDGDILVKKTTSNRLYKDSIIKVNHIVSFDKKRRFLNIIGKIEKPYLRQIELYLKLHFDIS